jgi:hypothetical protein
MTKRLRNLLTGCRFVLLRTGEKFRLLRREINTPSGTRYVVQLDNETRERSLHHACYVKPVVRVQEGWNG